MLEMILDGLALCVCFLVLICVPILASIYYILTQLEEENEDFDTFKVDDNFDSNAHNFNQWNDSMF